MTNFKNSLSFHSLGFEKLNSDIYWKFFPVMAFQSISHWLLYWDTDISHNLKLVWTNSLQRKETRCEGKNDLVSERVNMRTREIQWTILWKEFKFQTPKVPIEIWLLQVWREEPYAWGHKEKSTGISVYICSHPHILFWFLSAKRLPADLCCFTHISVICKRMTDF